jgi:hypothetical protein
MTRIDTTAGRRIESAKAMEIMKDFHLLLEEVETLLEEELIAVHFMRMADREKQVETLPMILKMPIRLLVGRKNRTMRQEAILAYAKKKLMELGGERSQESL